MIASWTRQNSLLDPVKYFDIYENCHNFMMKLCWADGKVTCPRCGGDRVAYLANARKWKSYAKHSQPTLMLKTGTIFEDSPIGLSKWLPAAWLVINCKNGISSYEVSRAPAFNEKKSSKTSPSQ